MTTELQVKSLELLVNIQKLDELTKDLMGFAKEIQDIADRLKDKDKTDDN